MKEELFRKKSLEKISSPEQVNDYIKTSSVGVWVIFCAAAILLAGAVIWGIFGKIDITVGGVAICENNSVFCFIAEDDIDRIPDTATVRIKTQNYSLADISKLPVPAKENMSAYALHLGNISEDEWVYYAPVHNADLDDGIYKAEIIVESVSPISLLMN